MFLFLLCLYTYNKMLDPVSSFLLLKTSLNFNGYNGINILVELELSVYPVATLLKKKSCCPHLSTFTAVLMLCTGMRI